MTRDPLFLTVYSTVLNGIAFVCRILTGVSLVVLTGIFGWLVYGRYVLNSTPTWVEQVALLLIMVIAFLGAAVGVHDNTHLSVELLRNSVPKRIKLALLAISNIILAVFGFYMMWFGTTLTMFKWGSQIPLINVPEGLRSLPLAVGGALILLFSIGHLLRLAVGRSSQITD